MYFIYDLYGWDAQIDWFSLRLPFVYRDILSSLDIIHYVFIYLPSQILFMISTNATQKYAFTYDSHNLNNIGVNPNNIGGKILLNCCGGKYAMSLFWPPYWSKDIFSYFELQL